MPLVYALEFRGTAVSVDDRLLVVHATAPGCRLVTRFRGGRVAGAFETLEGEEALLGARINLLGDGRFHEEGSVSFGGLEILRFHSLQPGELTPTALPELRQGVVLLAIDGGDGSLRGATGRIASSSLLSDTGELTDRHLSVVFAGTRDSPEASAGADDDDGAGAIATEGRDG